MYLDEDKAPREYRKLLKSLCSFDKDMCREMTPVINSIIKDETRHGKAVKKALDEYCVRRGD